MRDGYQAIGPGSLVGGRYLIQRILGRGGFGTVYYALQSPLDRPVALKVCHFPEDDDAATGRFEGEARIIGRLRSPHTVRLYDYGKTSDGHAYFAMELIGGSTLSEELALGPMAPKRAARIVSEACESLAEAHVSGVLHLDLKPGNLMTEAISGRGEITRVLDFGIARRWDSGTPKALESGGLAGTPRYMAPEYFRGGALTPQTDLYALGLILDECLRGQATFGEVKSPLFLGRHFEHVPSLPGACPAELIEVRDALLQVDPAHRPPDAVHVQRLLKAWVQRVESSGIDLPPAALIAAPSPTAPTMALDSCIEDRTAIMDGDPNWTLQESEVTCVVPFYSGEFIGRGDELEVLRSSTKAGKANLITLTGTGGSGKTRLAARYAQEAVRDYPGGIYFCDLSDADGLEALTSAVATALGVPLRIGEPAQQLANVFAGRPHSLIVLDNFEQLLPYAEDTLGVWLQRVPLTRFLVTSREAIRLPNEHVVEVSPFMTQEAVALFFAIAEEVSPGQCDPQGDRARVADLVGRLDGIPLAIELAAKRLRTLTLDQLTDRLKERFRLLTTRGRSLDDRRSMMWAAIDWSWSLLTRVEQSIFVQCSIFRGGFSLATAESVLSFSSPNLDLDEVIAALVDKHLLQRASPFAGVVRFTMYESLREYAAFRLIQPHSMPDFSNDTQPDPARSLRVKHVQHFAELGSEEAQLRYLGLEASVAVPLLALEMENLRLAKDFALADGLYAEALSCARAMLAGYSIEGPITAGVRILEPLLALPLPPAMLAFTWELYGWWSRGIRPTSEVLERLQSAKEMANAVGEARAAARISARLVFIRAKTGTTAADLVELRGLKADAEAVGDHETLRVVYDHLPLILQAQGQMEEAYQAYQAAERYFSNKGNLRGAARTASHLGNLLDDRGQRVAAEACYKRSMTLYVQLKDRVNQGSVFGNLAFMKASMGMHREALTYYRTALRVNRAVGNRVAEAYTLGNMGDLYISIGKPREARPRLEEAVRLCSELGDYTGGGAFRASLALLLAQAGDFETAGPLAIDALDMLRDVDLVEHGKALCKVGQMRVLEGRQADAEHCWVKARAVAVSTQATPESALAQEIDLLSASLGSQPPRP